MSDTETTDEPETAGSDRPAPTTYPVPDPTGSYSWATGRLGLRLTRAPADERGNDGR